MSRPNEKILEEKENGDGNIEEKSKIDKDDIEEIKELEETEESILIKDSSDSIGFEEDDIQGRHPKDNRALIRMDGSLRK